VEIRGRVEISEDPENTLLYEMYARYMGGATPPPEPEAERSIVRITPEKLYGPSAILIGGHPVPQRDSAKRRPYRADVGGARISVSSDSCPAYDELVCYSVHCSP